MTPATDPDEPLSLANCDREPIHIPGAVQPHGALLAFDRLGRLTHHSGNAAALLGSVPPLGRGLRAADLGGSPAVHAFVRDALDDSATEDVAPRSLPCTVAGREFDLVVHAHDGVTVCEFELRDQSEDQLAQFAGKAYRAMDGLKRQRSIERLLETAVQEIRALTGFDRVMGYRFRHDDSGDVVAEARREDLEPFLGRRYPASDIPAQARRLYTINTLRLIPDASYEPVPLRADAAVQQPLDLSHSVLRSVSPIHLEYLRNMGVQASMSISIVINGRLWGMFACHHMAPRRVPWSTRMAADVMAHLIASTIQSLLATRREASVARAAQLRTDLLARLGAGDTVLDGLAEAAPALAANLGCDALLVAAGGKVAAVHGEVDEAWADALLQGLRQAGEPLVHVSRADALPPATPGMQPVYCGLLGLRFDAVGQGWLVGLRREQVETIRWGGRPEKVVAHGPLGPRLTPRGSFAEWRETVRGTAVPWDDTELEIATQLLDAVGRAHADRVLSLDRARSQLWAVLGHDLRNPLQSLSMASKVIDLGAAGAQSDRMHSVIRNSTNRIERLVSDVLDISRLHHGMGLVLAPQPVDLAALLSQLVEEVQVAHPGTVIEVQAPATLPAVVDPGRYAQVVANLLSNARHHGSGGIGVSLRQAGDAVVLVVSNAAEPIAPDIAATLFDPFKRASLAKASNPSGMGLGLYIASRIVQAHQGSLDYRWADGRVSFVAQLPLAPPASAAPPA